MAQLDLIFAGGGEFGLPTLRRLAAQPSKYRFVQVVSQPDRPAGRGRKLKPTAISQFALDQDVPLVRTESINTEKLPAADVMVVIAFGQKIAERQVRHPGLGSINLHASLLPKYRGAAPINWAIVRGERVTGNTVIRLAQKMDAGAILGQSRIEIGDLETAGELHDRLAVDGSPLIESVLESLALGTANEQPQDEAQATLAPKLNRESTRIDWSRPAVEIANQIRGLYSWPGCRVRLLDASCTEQGRAILSRARPAAGEGPGGRPGEIMASGGVACGTHDGVEILEIQPEGKRPMSLPDYRNGHAWQPGMLLQSMV